MTYQLTHHHHDVIIIGAGGAGLRAAVAACHNGANVACISKVPPMRSHTIAAQGGINAALGNRVGDDWHWHMYDTIRGSDWLGDQDAIAYMCEHAAESIIELENMGMPFTRDKNGQIYQRAYGGQQTEYGKGGPAYRACAVADRTGHSLLHTLYSQAHRFEVDFFEEYIALDLLFNDENTCCGLIAWQLETGDLHVFHAHSVIIATGGFGQTYASTTSSTICTGDGNAMVLRAGLPLQDMEFIQFHPTGLYGTGILITEGARGEGAILLNGQGERFMERYAPSNMELASRDVISRSMIQEIIEGRGCGENKDHLLLSLAHLEPSVIDSQLPAIKDIAATFARIDVLKQDIPVVPAVHYAMGGIPCNIDGQVLTGDNKKTVQGLYAVGEAACSSVHGANRLGCNSLLELVVFGKSVGSNAADYAKKQSSHQQLQNNNIDHLVDRFDKLHQSRGSTRPNTLRKEMQKIMQDHTNIFRNQSLLEQGQKKLRDIWQRMGQDLLVADTSTTWNNDLLEALELDNLLRQASIVMDCALARTESRGSHWREDFPTRNDKNWLKHSIAFIDDTGKTRLDTREVCLTATEEKTNTPLSYPPEERIY